MIAVLAMVAASLGQVSFEATVVVGDRIVVNNSGNGLWFDSRDWLRPGEMIQIRGTVEEEFGSGWAIYSYRDETYRSGVYLVQREDAFWIEPTIPMQPDGMSVLGVSFLQYPSVDSYLVSAYDDRGPQQSEEDYRINPYADAYIRAEVTEFSMLVTGDSNRDGAFDSGDLVTAFTAGKYGTGEVAYWEDGDWNANMVFESRDFVTAFQTGLYETQTARAVPEPSTFVLLMISLPVLLRSLPSRKAQRATFQWQ